MKKVLVINSSARALRSHSRKLTEVFIDHWKTIHTDPIINFRELGSTDVPHINENWIAAAFKPAAARSEEEIEALKQAILIFPNYGKLMLLFLLLLCTTGQFPVRLRPILIRFSGLMKPGSLTQPICRTRI